MAQVVEAGVLYSAHSDVLMVLREPSFGYYGASSGDPLVARLVSTDTGELVGVEIVGFLEFEEWDAVPDAPGVLWKLPGEEPLPLRDLLKGQQRELRTASSGAGAA